jgi:hypothetical protein
MCISSSFQTRLWHWPGHGRASSQLHPLHQPEKRVAWIPLAGTVFSCPIEKETALIRCVAYVLRNPVRAGLVKHAADWKYSNAKTLFAKRADPIADHTEVLDLIPDWAEQVVADADEAPIRLATQTGRPFGSVSFVEELERLLRRPLAPKRRGPKTRFCQ